MGIARRVEYIRYCDVRGCCMSDGADWRTREEAEQAAIRDGWHRLSARRWMCPDCKEKAEDVSRSQPSPVPQPRSKP